MFMSAMVQIFSWGERWNVPFKEVKPSWMVHISSSWKCLFHCTNEKTFIICFIYLVQRFKFCNKFKRKSSKKQLLTQAKHFTSRASNSMWKALHRRLRHAKCTHCACCIWVSHLVFLISLFIEHTSEDCIGNTEHSNINVNDECNS